MKEIALALWLLAGWPEAGAIPAAPPGARFLSVTDTAPLTVDAATVAVGDRLAILDATGAVVGRLAIVATRPMTGKIVEATREIAPPVTVAYTLPRERQLSPYLPFIGSVATAVGGEAPLPVAITDVTLPNGDRTDAGDRIARRLADDICSRPRFVCVDRRRVTEALWKGGAATAGSMPQERLSEVAEAVGADGLVVGKLDGNDLWLAWIGGASTRPLWWRFTLDPARPAGTDRVTATGGLARGGMVTIRLTPPERMADLSADEVIYVDLRRRIADAGEGAPTVAGYFADVDGRRYRLADDGTLFSAPLPPGRATVTVGYQPTVDGRPLGPPVTREMELAITAGFETTILFGGQIRGKGGALAVRSIRRRADAQAP